MTKGPLDLHIPYKAWNEEATRILQLFCDLLYNMALQASPIGAIEVSSALPFLERSHL